jgi:cysteine sulfinate desulfinase/cysteine desulfurase-like protein
MDLNWLIGKALAVCTSLENHAQKCKGERKKEFDELATIQREICQRLKAQRPEEVVDKDTKAGAKMKLVRVVHNVMDLYVGLDGQAQQCKAKRKQEFAELAAIQDEIWQRLKALRPKVVVSGPPELIKAGQPELIKAKVRPRKK